MPARVLGASAQSSARRDRARKNAQPRSGDSGRARFDTISFVKRRQNVVRRLRRRGRKTRPNRRRLVKNRAYRNLAARHNSLFFKKPRKNVAQLMARPAVKNGSAKGSPSHGAGSGGTARPKRAKPRLMQAGDGPEEMEGG